MKKTLLTALALAFGLAASGCKNPADSDPTVLAIAATVRFVDIEGGCWVLATRAGTYEPFGFPKALLRDGQQVLVWFRLANDLASACQVGYPVRVDSARAR